MEWSEVVGHIDFFLGMNRIQSTHRSVQIDIFVVAI